MHAVSSKRRAGAVSSASSSLQASTTTPPIPTPSHPKVKMAAATTTSAEPGLLEPTGVHHPFYSLSPLTGAKAWAAREEPCFNGLIEANGGASVFKGHPGLDVTFLTDQASCEWFFSQSQEVLDRQDGAYFGPLKRKQQYIGESLPTLASNQKEMYQVLREHKITVIRSRLPFAQSAMTNATDTFYKNLRDIGLGEYTLAYDFFLQQAIHFLHEWIFGMGVEGGQPLPPFKDFINANPPDVSVAKKASLEQLASVESIVDAIRLSEVWAGFVEMLEGCNANTKDLEREFMFITNVQAAAGMAKIMTFVVATLANNAEFLGKLSEEVDGKILLRGSL
ncbi:unnamed protein product [Ectocarpus sp. CCAP 1310/34]|nr:unnamed protein product [Ectocarpus sp. CCAP 1310/34]